MKSDKEILRELRKASLGLLYLSESDYPFDLISWDGHIELTSSFIRGITSEAADGPIEEIEIDTFLAGRYQKLAQFLKTNLASLKGFKVGRINMPVYLVGRSPEGNWLGLSTRVVET